MINYLINRWKITGKKKKFQKRNTCSKLNMYGITENEFEWIRSYLTERKQMTKVNGKLNNVPQGSILGVLLFIIYMNDMPCVLKGCIIICRRRPNICEFVNTFNIEDLCENNNDIIIAGDFNIVWQSDFYKSKLENILNDKRLKRIVKEFTRITKNSNSINRLYNHK